MLISDLGALQKMYTSLEEKYKVCKRENAEVREDIEKQRRQSDRIITSLKGQTSEAKRRFEETKSLVRGAEGKVGRAKERELEAADEAAMWKEKAHRANEKMRAHEDELRKACMASIQLAVCVCPTLTLDRFSGHCVRRDRLLGSLCSPSSQAAETLEDEMQSELDEMMEDAQEQLLVEQEASESRLERVLKKVAKLEEQIEFEKSERQALEEETIELKRAATEELEAAERELDAAVSSRNEAWSEADVLREEARQALRKAATTVSLKEGEHAKEALEWDKERDELQAELSNLRYTAEKQKQELENALEEAAERHVDREEKQTALESEVGELRGMLQESEETRRRARQELHGQQRDEISRWSREVDSLREQLEHAKAETAFKVAEMMRAATLVTGQATARVEEGADVVERMRAEAAEAVECANRKAIGFKTEMEREMERQVAFLTHEAAAREAGMKERHAEEIAQIRHNLQEQTAAQSRQRAELEQISSRESVDAAKVAQEVRASQAVVEEQRVANDEHRKQQEKSSAMATLAIQTSMQAMEEQAKAAAAQPGLIAKSLKDAIKDVWPAPASPPPAAPVAPPFPVMNQPMPTVIYSPVPSPLHGPLQQTPYLYQLPPSPASWERQPVIEMPSVPVQKPLRKTTKAKVTPREARREEEATTSTEEEDEEEIIEKKVKKKVVKVKKVTPRSAVSSDREEEPVAKKRVVRKKVAKPISLPNYASATFAAPAASKQQQDLVRERRDAGQKPAVRSGSGPVIGFGARVMPAGATTKKAVSTKSSSGATRIHSRWHPGS